jgi:hypothetical protein
MARCWARQLSRLFLRSSLDLRRGHLVTVALAYPMAYFVAFPCQAQIRLAGGADHSLSGHRICCASLPGKSFWASTA